MKNLSKILFCLCLTSAAHVALALQVVDGEKDETFVAKVSVRDVTRIALEHGRIRSFVANDGEMQIEKNSDTGQLYLRPVNISNKASSLFISDEQGRTYTLLLVPTEMPADAVIIRDRTIYTKKILQENGFGNSIESKIKSMILALIKKEPISTYEANSKKLKSILLPDSLSVRLLNDYVFEDISGYHFQLKNIGKNAIYVKEEDFYETGVLAVVLESKTLSINSVTSLYLLKEKQANE